MNLFTRFLINVLWAGSEIVNETEFILSQFSFYTRGTRK